MLIQRRTILIAAAGFAAATLAAVTVDAQSAGDPAEPPPDATTTVSLAPGSQVGIDSSRNTVIVGNPISLLNSCADPVCSVEGGDPFQVTARFSTTRPVDLLRVPAGKVAIVKYISAQGSTFASASVPNPSPIAWAALNTSGGASHFFTFTALVGASFHLLAQRPITISVLSQQLTFYARSGSTISFSASASVHQNGNNLAIDDTTGDVTISGVIVNEH